MRCETTHIIPAVSRTRNRTASTLHTPYWPYFMSLFAVLVRELGDTTHCPVVPGRADKDRSVLAQHVRECNIALDESGQSAQVRHSFRGTRRTSTECTKLVDLAYICFHGTIHRASVRGSAASVSRKIAPYTVRNGPEMARRNAGNARQFVQWCCLVMSISKLYT